MAAFPFLISDGQHYSPRRPRVGIIGAGFIGRFHAQALRGLFDARLADGEIIGVADLDAERAGALAREFAIPIAVTDAERLIANERINTVYICTPTATHRDLIVMAAGADKAVFAEKPLATNLDDVGRIVAAAERARVPAQVGLVLRYAPTFVVLRELMQNPGLGRPMSVIFHDDQFFPIAGHYASDWRKEFETAGGGALIEHSIHDVDLLHWLLGPVTAVTAQTRNFAGHTGVEDVAAVLFEFESGCVGTLTSTWHQVPSRRSTRLIEVVFERGLFRVEDDFVGPIQIEATGTNGRTVMSEEQVRSRYLSLAGLEPSAFDVAPGRWTFEDLFFLRAVTEGGRPWPDFGIAYDAHRIVDAIYRSAAAGGARIEPLCR
jgi:predicted dehydrogenase